MAHLSIARAVAREHMRDLSYSLWSLILPPVVYGVAALFLADGTAAREAAILGATLLGVTCTAGCVSFPMGLRALEDQGLYRALRLRPVPPWQLVASATAADTLILLGSCALVAAVAAIRGLLGAPLPQPPAWAAATAVAVAVSMAMGAALWSTGASFLALKNYGNVVLLPYLLGAGIFFHLPGVLDTVGSLLPSYQINRLLLTGDPRTLMVPGVWIAACVAYTALRARRGRSDA